MKSYLKAFRNYAVFKGRATRREYWMFFLIDIIIMILLAQLWNLNKTFIVAFYVYFAIRIVPSWAVTARRLHDLGKSGWLQIIYGFIPCVGGILLLALLAEKGQPSDNQYGANPRQTPDVIIIEQ